MHAWEIKPLSRIANYGDKRVISRLFFRIETIPYSLYPVPYMAKPLRVPPQTIESEKALLGALMIRADSMPDIVDALSPDAFYAGKHAIIYRAMLALWTKNEPIDIESVRAKLADQNQLEQVGGVLYLTELASNVPAASNARHYANLVQKKFVLRSLTDAGEYVPQLAFY